MICGGFPNDDFPEIVDPVDGTRWRVDAEFLTSNWTCVWGNGCQGILDEPAEDLQQGCCSVGAEFLDEEEAMLIGALGVTLDPGRFEHHAEASADGVFNADRTKTRIVDDACIFLNRPGFSGGAGCALHLTAIDEGESPIEWKPSICWQLPLKVETDTDGTRTLRRWRRADWGDGGKTMAWCCTEEAAAHVGDRPVIESLSAEIQALVGPEVAVELRSRLGRSGPAS